MMYILYLYKLFIEIKNNIVSKIFLKNLYNIFFYILDFIYTI